MSREKAWKFWNYFSRKMKQYPHIFCLVLILVMLLFRMKPGVTGTLETMPPPPPQRIATKIYDCYSGNLFVRDVLAGQAELSLIFYYAPWCARSMDALREFEAAADVLRNQVRFIAVNCWWIEGECRGALHFQQFPQIYAHHKNIKKGFLYNGPFTKDHFINFLENVMDPLHYLNTNETTEEFLNENQLTVIAYFGLTLKKEPLEFLKYSVLAIRHLAENPSVPLCFGVITDAKIANVYYLKPDILQLRDQMFPRRVVYYDLNSSTEQLLNNFTKLKKKVVAPDLHLPGAKSNFLYQTLKNGPTLITFLSSAVFNKREHYVKKVRQLVVKYKRCIEGLLPPYSSAIYRNNPTNKFKCCQSVLNRIDLWNSTIVCNMCLVQDVLISSTSCGLFEEILSFFVNEREWKSFHEQSIQTWDTATCSETRFLYDSQRTRLDACCMSYDYFTKELEEQRKKNNMPEFCTLKHENSTFFRKTDCDVSVINDTSANDPSVIFYNNISAWSLSSDVLGLNCQTNRTLEFLTLDLDRHKALSENLGVDKHVYTVGDVSMGAVIVDPINEVQHVMASSRFHLENFIINYTLGILPQSYHTSDEVERCSTNTTHVCVHEVTSETFDEIVMNNNKDVLLLYYVPWCGACSSISHVFLSLAKLINHPPIMLLARINAYENELPLQFTVQSYPTLIFFPAYRSSYSVVYPQDEEITVANLLRFLFQNTSWKTTSQILLNLCMSGHSRAEVRHEACKKWNVARNK